MAEEGKNLNTAMSMNYEDDAGNDPTGLGILRNYGLSPVIQFSFMLRVEGIYDLPCRAVKSFRRENEFEYIQEGGLNDYVHLKRKPITRPFTFQVERYVGVDWIDPLPMGAELILPVILFVNKFRFSNASFKPARTYAFTGCTVIAKDYGELNAEKSGLLTETTTIAYREMICVDMPSAAGFMDMDTWSFNGTDKEGKGERFYNQSSVNTDWEKKKSKEEMEKEAKSHRWSFHQQTKAGTGMSSANHSLTELQDTTPGASSVEAAVEEDWNKKARKWSFNQQTKAGAGTSSANHSLDEQRDATGGASAVEAAVEEDWNKKARKWSFDQQTKAGTGTSSANHSLDEQHDATGGASAVEAAVKETWLENAKRWPDTASARQIEDFLKTEGEGGAQGTGEAKAERLWGFGKDGSGEGTRSAVTQKEKSEGELDGAAREWEFDGANKAGTGSSSANHSLTELQNNEDGPSAVEAAVKQDWLGKAKRWPAYRSARQIADFLNK